MNGKEKIEEINFGNNNNIDNLYIQHVDMAL